MNNEQIKRDALQHIWYPFTQMKDFMDEDPIVIEHGDGNYLIDVDGNRYLDGVSSLWTNVHGHRNEKLDRALKDQVDKIAHSTLLGLSNVAATECAKKLVEITPEALTRVFYSDSGSTAMEIAMKIAFQYHQQADEAKAGKNKFVTIKNAYHGDTIGSIRLGGIDLFHEIFGPLLFDTFKAESPYCYRCPLGLNKSDCNLACVQSVESIMQEHGHEICALVVEPLVQGAAGIITQPAGYLKKLRELCDQYDILMIADEVAVGFGKTGSMFACDKAGVVPDILAMAKGISGGYLPLAATMTTEKIYDGFLAKYEEFKTFFHGHTYTGNPLACAVAIANMELFEENSVIDKLQPKIAKFTSLLEPFKGLKHVGEVRQEGVMVGIELVQDKETKAMFPVEAKIPHQVILEARKQGMIIRPLGNVIIMMPPLSITEDELTQLCEVTFQSIRKITEG